MSAADNQRVIVIGAGLGGMSAAIMLARNGFKVTVLEKNAHLGGKLNQLQTQGFSFDLGPSIFTLPQIFRPIFEGDGRRLEDYISLERVDPQWRNSRLVGRPRENARGTGAVRLGRRGGI